MKRLKIKSDGTWFGTGVYIEDELLAGVVSVHWVTEEGKDPEVFIKVKDVEIDAELDVKDNADNRS